MVLPPLAIVWRCPLEVEQYAAQGKEVTTPRPDCPDCGMPLRFRSGYWRHVRAGGGTGRPVWVRRAQCVACKRSHALLPSFLLQRRLDVVDDIGAVVEAVVDGGAVTAAAAEAADVPYTTARDWLRRLRARAPALAAGFVAVAVEVGAEAGVAALAVAATPRVLAALRLLAGAVASSLSSWALASLVTGLTVYGPDCQVQRYGPGEPYIGGDSVHLARNEGEVPVEMGVTYLSTPGQSMAGFREPHQAPAACPVQ